MATVGTVRRKASIRLGRGAGRSIRAMHASLHEGLALAAAGGTDQALPIGLKPAFGLLGRRPLAPTGWPSAKEGAVAARQTTPATDSIRIARVMTNISMSAALYPKAQQFG